MTEKVSEGEAQEVVSSAGFYAESANFTWLRHEVHARVEGTVLDRVLTRHLPPAPAAIADVGGGNGRWAYRLSGRGYQVWLSDVTPELIFDAGQRATDQPRLMDCRTADARQLPYADGSMDACLLLGPLYGLLRREDRIDALRETVRVLRPGGVAFLQSFTRLGGLRSLLTYAPVQADLFDWSSYLDTGRFTDEHLPDLYRSHAWLTEGELLEEIRTAGLTLEWLTGMDGPAPGTGQDHLAEAPIQFVEQWADIAMQVGSSPAGRATADHLLAVARS